MEQDAVWSNGRKYLDMQLYFEKENSKNEDLQKMCSWPVIKHSLDKKQKYKTGRVVNAREITH